MWTIKQIFDGDYGCEEPGENGPQVLVTLTDETGNQRSVTVPDAWLVEQGLDLGSPWPCALHEEDPEHDRKRI